MLSIADITSADDHKPEIQFNEYLRVRKICDPNGSVAVQTKAFHVAMAEHFYDLYEKKGYTEQQFADLSEAHFTAVLELDSLDCDANYNVAVNLYNQGVFKIKQFGITTDIADLIRIQDESIGLFKQSLPYLKVAYQNCPNRVNLIRAMYVINRALDNEEEAELYKSQLEKALKNNP
jgi:tetratricopeptide (TPR) repeat protein